MEIKTLVPRPGEARPVLSLSKGGDDELINISLTHLGRDQHGLVSQVSRNAYPTVFQRQFILGKPAHGLRISLVFLNQNPCGEAVFGIAIKHRHGGLNDDRAVIERRRYKMDGTTVNPYALLQRPLVRVQAGKEGSSEG